MLSYIDFEHYRIFSGRQSLKLAPITVIFGKNNIGKNEVKKEFYKMKFLFWGGLRNRQNLCAVN